MKKLLLLRHAEAVESRAAMRDFDRELTDAGRQDASAMGALLKARAIFPSFIISSPGLRAKETLELFSRAAQIDIKPQFEESIYGAMTSELLRLIRKLPDDKLCVLIVGHNPGLQDLLARLTGQTKQMSTASLACLEFAVDKWQDIENNSAKLVYLLAPRQ